MTSNVIRNGVFLTDHTQFPICLPL